MPSDFLIEIISGIPPRSYFIHPPRTTLRAYYVNYVEMLEMSYIVEELAKFEG